MSTPRKTYSLAESGAFVEVLQIEPYASGPLDGLRFAVKDVIDLAGLKTGCGNPDWARTHPVAAVNAVCVDQLLLAGARCVGKTVCDELAFSLEGENFFYGAPLNPRAPERVAGGSSSGSAAAVACGLADFALGTDTGGSVRVPASNCGLYGLRPSHGFISTAGVVPYAPSIDTVGVLAASADILVRAAAVLLSCQVPGRVEPGCGLPGARGLGAGRPRGPGGPGPGPGSAAPPLGAQGPGNLHAAHRRRRAGERLAELV